MVTKIGGFGNNTFTLTVHYLHSSIQLRRCKYRGFQSEVQFFDTLKPWSQYILLILRFRDVACIATNILTLMVPKRAEGGLILQPLI